MPDEIQPAVSSHDTERAVLGAIMRGGAAAYEKAAEIITPTDFFIHRFRFVWEAFAALHGQGLSIDTISVGDELARAEKLDECGGRVFLAELRSEGDPRSITTYCATVKDYSLKREIFRIASEAASAAANGKRADVIMADLNAKMAKLSIYNQDDHTVEIGVAASEAYDWTDRASRNEIGGIITGLADLDNILGTLIPENMYIVGGRPGTGKTAFMLTVALAAALRGKRVAFFSLEMSRMQIAQRLVAMLSGVDLHRIINGKLRDDEWPKFVQATEEVSRLPIVINDWSGINVTGARRVLRRLVATGKVDLVCFDYIQLAETEEKAKSREQEVAAISRGLKKLAGELKIPFLVGAQLSRESEKRADKLPQLSDLRESGSLEQDAYVVMFLHRSDKPEKANITDLIVAKHRNGPLGTVDLVFRGPIAKFENAVSRTVSFDPPAYYDK